MEKESHLQELSLIDELTGIYNRRGFRLLAQQQIEIAKRTGRGLMVCFFDLDHMKNINDVYGHGAGDAIIRAAVGVLKKTFRSSDILSRWGGDEFVVMMINAGEEDMPSIEERILSHIHGYNDTADHRYVLSLSWGTCRYDPSGADTLDDLITRSDAEMYRSKTRKRS